MADKKVGSETELKVAKNQKNKEQWSAKKIATTVIIVILAFLMIGGSFYYIFTPGFREDANAFGSYDGKSINYESNNVFGRTLQNDQDYAKGYEAGDYTQIYKSWNLAYQAQVIYEALNGMAEKAKIASPDDLVKDFILKSGIYNGENGEFDEELYNSVNPGDRQLFSEYVRNAVPYQIVLEDFATAFLPEGEKTFISDLNKNARDFSYFNVDFNVYPSDLAKNYVEENKDLFTKLNLSIITCETQENANKAYDALKAGQSWSDVVKNYSLDNYAENDGNLGAELYANIVATNLADANELSKITSLSKDEFSVPVQGPYAWAIYKLNDYSTEPDTEDEALISYAKSVIYANSKDVVKPYIDNAVSAAEAEINVDFDNAASLYSTGLVEVKGATNNIGASQFAVGLQYSDPTAALALEASENEELVKKLFTGKKGQVIGPVETEDGTLFVRIDEEESTSSMASIVDSYYEYYKNQLSWADLRDAVISSDKHEDNFAQKFFEVFLGNAVAGQQN